MKKKILFIAAASVLALAAAGCSSNNANESSSVSESSEETSVSKSSSSSSETSDVSSSSSESASSAESVSADSEAINSEVENAIEETDEIVYDSETGELNLSLALSIGDTDISIPMAYSDLTAAGWIINENADGVAAANDYDLEYLSKNGSSITAYIYNNSSEDKEYAECEIIGVSISESDLGSTAASLPDGITVSESTLDDVLAAYGKPSQYYVGESTLLVEYMSDDTSNVFTLYFDYDTQVLNSVDIWDTTIM